MIVLENISKKFGDNIVLNNINLTLNSGKIYGFQGSNGSGKTILFKIICGFAAPSKGKVFVNNKQIGKDLDFPENCGVIIETPGFIERFSGYKNLKLLSSINNLIDDKRIIELMQLFDLDYKSNKKVKNYSLGMKQKLGLIQAIMEYPKILILDEPMNALDEKTVEKTRKLLKSIKDDCIILISSHNKEDIIELCDEIFFINNGTLKKL